MPSSRSNRLAVMVVVVLSAGTVASSSASASTSASEAGRAVPSSRVTATQVQVTFVDDDLVWKAPARAAVRAAASAWGRRLGSTVPVTVRAVAGTIGGTDGTLAYAAPVSFVRNRGTSPAVTDDVFEPVALANARLGRDARPGEPDIEARFDLSQGPLYLGTDGRTPPYEYDLETLALHELGHGLGVVGSAGLGTPASLGREGAPGTDVVDGSRTPFSYDRFTCTVIRPGSCTPLMSLPDGSPQLATAYTSGALYWSGARATAANGGRRVKLFAPSVIRPGASYVHLDEDTYRGWNALMTPVLSTGQALHQPGPIAVGMLADMGWPLAATH